MTTYYVTDVKDSRASTIAARYKYNANGRSGMYAKYRYVVVSTKRIPNHAPAAMYDNLIDAKTRAETLSKEMAWPIDNRPNNPYHHRTTYVPLCEFCRDRGCDSCLNEDDEDTENVY